MDFELVAKCIQSLTDTPCIELETKFKTETDKYGWSLHVDVVFDILHGYFNSLKQTSGLHAATCALARTLNDLLCSKYYHNTFIYGLILKVANLLEMAIAEKKFTTHV